MDLTPSTYDYRIFTHFLYKVIHLEIGTYEK